MPISNSHCYRSHICLPSTRCSAHNSRPDKSSHVGSNVCAEHATKRAALRPEFSTYLSTSFAAHIAAVGKPNQHPDWPSRLRRRILLVNILVTLGRRDAQLCGVPERQVLASRLGRLFTV